MIAIKVMRAALAPLRLSLRLLPYPLRRRIRTRLLRSHFGVEAVRNAWIDRRYGGKLSGTIDTRFGALGHFGYSGSDYVALRRLFSAANGIVVGPDAVLVDVGCGLGRVLNFWLDAGLGKRQVGIEFDPLLADRTRDRLSSYPTVEVICGDVRECVPADGTIFFLFNPFGTEVLEGFKAALVDTFGRAAPITVIYYYSLRLSVFEDDPDWVVRRATVPTFHAAHVIRMAGAPAL